MAMIETIMNGRLRVVLLLLVLSLVGAEWVYAYKSGPDKFGYRCVDNYEPNGPDYQLLRFDNDAIKLEGKSAVGDTSLTASIPIGFNFEFYGKKYSYLYISGNGYLAFFTPGMSYDSPPYKGQEFPSPDQPNAIIAPFWSYNNGTA